MLCCKVTHLDSVLIELPCFLGMNTVDAIADLIDQIGFAFRDYYIQEGNLRRHTIPIWAWELAIVSMSLVVIALVIEWYIVRRTLAVKRSLPGLQVDAVKGRTHLLGFA